jgi:dienelactone hydrolase
VHETRPFAFTAADGAALGGHLTWPTKPRAATPPLLVIFPSDSSRPRPAWDPEAQVFADFGFAVARLHPRSAASAHAAAPEELAVADAHAALAALAQPRPAAPAVDLRRVAVLGRGFGGHLAVRAVQWRPDAFHAAVALDAPLDPADETAPPHPAAPHAASPGHHRHPAASRPEESRTPAAPVASVLAEAEKLTQPLLLLGDPRRHPARDASAAALRTRLESLGRKVAHVPLDPDFAAARPAALAAAYRRIDEFLAAHLPPPAPKAGAAREAP